METSHNGDPDPFVVFTPRLGKFLLTELWSAAVGLVVVALLLQAGGLLSGLWFWGTLAAGLVGIAFGAVFLKRLKSIVIGDTWMTGPTGGSSEPITILFDTLDVSGTGIRKGRLQIRSISGREISAKAAWYAAADIHEIQRLVRDRASHSGAEGASLPRID